MATDFKYASQSDLQHYYSAFSQFDAKRQVFGWTLLGATYQDVDTATSCYIAENVGLVTNLFIDGQDMSVRKQSIPSAQLGDSGADTAEVLSYGETEITTENTHNQLVDPGWIIGIQGTDEKMLVIDTASANTVQVRRGFDGTTQETSDYSTDSGLYFWTKLSQKGEWTYSSNDDCLLLTWDSDPGDSVVEGGIDNATYFDQMLVNASMELNNLLDRRYPTPIPKYTQYDANTTHVSSAPEFDAIIIKSTCYLCVANLLRTNNRQEEADYYNNLVTNMDGSGLVDRLNKGEYKLSYEVDSDDSQGKVMGITKAGSMDIIEKGGAYSGEAFDLLRITCTTTGAYGVAIVKVEYYGSDKLFGSEKTDIKVTGGLQHIHGGFYCRFQGSSMTQNDLWEVEVYSETRKISNAESGAIQLTRRGYGI